MGELEKHARLFNRIAPVYNYFGFVRHGEKEMRTYYYDVTKIDVGPQTALYICSRQME